MILPRLVRDMLLGRAAEERKPKRAPIQWVARPPDGQTRVTHPSQGAFEVIDDTPPASPALPISDVDPNVAQALADEARRLAKDLRASG